MRVVFIILIFFSNITFAQCISFPEFKKNLCYQVVLDDITFGGYKRSVELVIPERYSKNELKKISEKVKSENTRNVNIFIAFYLGEKIEVNGYWATIYYTPDFKYTRYGVSDSDLQKLKKIAPPPNSIGSWLVDTSPGWLMTIVSDSIESYVLMAFSDGAEIKVLLQKDGKNTFRPVENQDEKLLFADYLVINIQDNLELRYNEDADFDMSHVARKI